MSLKTGDNPPKRGNVLKLAAGLLVREGIKLVKPIADYDGIYSYLMFVGGTHFYLVARGTPPMPWGYSYLQVVSSQKALLTIARQEDRPVLMAMFMNDTTPVWSLYHPAEVLEKSLGDNRRGRVVMVNFEYELGEFMMFPGNLASMWDRLKKRWEDDRSLVQTKIGRIA